MSHNSTRMNHSSTRPGRRGISSVVAVFFLVLFSALALGFYFQANMAGNLAENERRMTLSHVQAEGGLRFIQYHLRGLDVMHCPDPARQFEELYGSLAAVLDGTGNLGGGFCGYQPGLISIPERGFVRAHPDGSGFRIEIRQDGRNIVVKSIGRCGDRVTEDELTGARAAEIDCVVVEHTSDVFKYGIASRGAVEMNGNARIVGVPADKGSFLSTSHTVPTPLKMGGSSSISGSVSFSSGGANVSLLSNASIAGSKDPSVYKDYVFRGVAEPEFPVIDTSMYEPFARNVLSTVGATYSAGNLKNVRIKANTNPRFDGGIEVQGVVYVEAPNVVTFDNNVVVRGAIVVQNDPPGSPAINKIVFNSNVRLYSMDTLPAYDADFPAELRELDGSMIIAPKFDVVFNSNFQAARGSIIAGQMTWEANASGTIEGHLIAMEDRPMVFNSNTNISIQPSDTRLPDGLFFGHHFAAVDESYREVPPDSFAAPSKVVRDPAMTVPPPTSQPTTQPASQPVVQPLPSR